MSLWLPTMKLSLDPSLESYLKCSGRMVSSVEKKQRTTGFTQCTNPRPALCISLPA